MSPYSFIYLSRNLGRKEAAIILMFREQKYSHKTPMKSVMNAAYPLIY